MRAFFILLRLRLAEVFRGRASLAFLFGLPLVILLLVAALFGDGHPFERRRVLVLARDAAIDATTKLHPELRVTYGNDDLRALESLDAREVDVVLTRRPDEASLRVVVRPDDLLLARGLASAIGEPTLIEPRPSKPRGYVLYLFPGLLAFAALVSGLFGSAYFLARHRQTRFLKKLATTPLSPAVFVAAQLVARTLLSVAQLSLVLLAARLFLSMPLDPMRFFRVAFIVAVGTLSFMGVGFALACAIEDESTIVDVINALITPLVLGSEIFFPLDVLPRPIAAVAQALPTTQLVRALRAALVHGATLGELGLPLLVLASWALLTYGIAVSAFRIRAR